MSEITEINTGFNALINYLKAQETYLLSGGTPPDARLLYLELDYPELLTYCNSQVIQGAGYEIGVAQEAISTIAASLRELGMATTSKSLIYTSHQSEIVDEYQFYSQSKDFYTGVLKGNSTSGSQC